ncbi:MAG TPA: HEAT repeat domain-containing protein, partial [Thermoguttaceae bacterium]|nr:HEAT repeat domain-containing protein [Thermoguttaceae bacterium]
MSQSNDDPRLVELVQKLREPRTRRAARQELVAARAVGPLVQCLESRNESVVWAAVESLDELRATEAVAPLIQLLERGTLTLDVCEALTHITGQDFGADAKRWRDWTAADGGDTAPRLDPTQCVRQTGEFLGVEPTGSDTSFRFKLSLPGDRTQKVTVYFGRKDAEGDELVVIYSECGPADERHYEAILRKNMSIPAGAFAIRDID